MLMMAIIPCLCLAAGAMILVVTENDSRITKPMVILTPATLGLMVGFVAHDGYGRALG